MDHRPVTPPTRECHSSRPLAAFVLLLILLPGFTGCRYWHEEQLPPGEFLTATAQDSTANRIVGVTLTTGEELSFDVEGREGAVLSGDTLYGAVEGESRPVALTDAERVWVEWRRTDVLSSVIGLTFGVAVVVVGIAAATKESCPFIYSWDGERWVFDAEPYGGATTKGLERADFTELESLVAVDGEYRLRITNEVNETQYTNFLELWAVHHPPGTRVVADEFGGLHPVRDPVPLRSAVDATGRDLMPWLAATDRRIWEPEPRPLPNGDLHQDIVLTFPRPEGATEGRLVANVATGGWGSHMIREFYEMHGTAVDDFYREIDTSPEARDEILAWNVREELFTLQVRVEEPTGWEVRGLLPGGGPFIAEHRVVPLDLSRVEGDVVRIRLRPPVGFWALNSFRMDYGPDEPVQVERTALEWARTPDGEDLLPLLSATDDRYYAMPETGDWAGLRFPAVEAPEGMEQTLILHSQGYYRLHLQPNQPPDTAAIRELETVPDAPVRAAVRSYARARTAAVAGDGAGSGMRR